MWLGRKYIEELINKIRAKTENQLKTKPLAEVTMGNRKVVGLATARPGLLEMDPLTYLASHEYVIFRATTSLSFLRTICNNSHLKSLENWEKKKGS